MADEVPAVEITPDMRMRAYELATRDMPYGYTSGNNTPIIRDIREITQRADRILEYAYGTKETTPAGLIAKLRAALCEG